jgi:hypothetical protein
MGGTYSMVAVTVGFWRTCPGRRGVPEGQEFVSGQKEGTQTTKRIKERNSSAVGRLNFDGLGRNSDCSWWEILLDLKQWDHSV